MKKPPIEPMDYLGGVKVVDIGDLRVARGITRRPPESCEHRNLTYDETERRIWCSDCEQEIDPFDAFVILVECFDTAHKRLDERASELSELETFTVRSRAAKAMDKHWRSRDRVPACPHCKRGILPDDVAGDKYQFASKEMEIARRNKEPDQ